ncbi:SpoIID/LytB domain-containing protein [Actinomycetota bacterium]
MSAIVAVGLGLGVITAPAPADLTPAAAAEPVLEHFARPAGASITFAGRGYGHGRGMSQWGAYGAATKGLTARQIMEFYYPGTAAGTTPNATIRVRLDTLAATGVIVAARPGLQLRDGATARALATVDGLGRAIDRWAILPDGHGLTLKWRSGGVWQASTTWARWPTPLTFSSTTSVVAAQLPGTSNLREYRGQLRVESVTGWTTRTVNLIGIEMYLRGVVPAEMPASWRAGALQAQSIAARTYAVHQKAGQPAGSTVDTCDTTACQVYKGVRDLGPTGAVVATSEQASTNTAVSATAGQIRTYAGAAAFTEFHASSGGLTAAGSQPYLVSKYDPYDAVVVSTSNPNTWRVTLPISAIETAYPQVGALTGLTVTGRPGAGIWGGRTTGIRVEGAAGSVTVSGLDFRMALRLRSEWWVQASAPARQVAAYPKDLTGDGAGDLFAVSSTGTGTVRAWRGSNYFAMQAGNSGWGDRSLIASPGPWDSDNRPDVLARTTDGRLWVYRGGGARLNQGMTLVASGFGGYNALLTPGDFDGDSYPDIVARRTDGEMYLFSGDGAGGIKGSRRIAGGWTTFGRVFSAGDLTGDGIGDLVGVYAADGRIRVYPGNGAGGMSPSRLLGPVDYRGYSHLMGVGDLTGDGRHDIVARRASNGTMWLIPVTGVAVLGPARALTATAAPKWAS